jgi:hypothetical protein
MVVVSFRVVPPVKRLRKHNQHNAVGDVSRKMIENAIEVNRHHESNRR